jgi:hypothetical protein
MDAKSQSGKIIPSFRTSACILPGLENLEAFVIWKSNHIVATALNTMNRSQKLLESFQKLHINFSLSAFGYIEFLVGFCAVKMLTCLQITTIFLRTWSFPAAWNHVSFHFKTIILNRVSLPENFISELLQCCCNCEKLYYWRGGGASVCDLPP